LGCFWDLEIAKFFIGVRMRRAIHVCSSKMVEIGEGYVAERPRCLDNKNKTRFGTLERNPWGDFAHFYCMSAHHATSLIFQISSR